MKIERTNNTISGTFWGTVNKVIMLVVPFIIRTCFIYTLGINYLGLTSLFSSILTALSLAELGFAGAIVYSMYKPIAENDTQQVCRLLNFYKLIYRYIGLFILVVGLLLIPFFPNLINGDIPNDINLILIYIVYLLNTVVSYGLFAYKTSILSALQRIDIQSNISSVISILMYVLQLVSLLVFANFYFYVISNLVYTVLFNLAVGYYTKKYYPEYICRGKLSKEEIKEILKQVGGLFAQRMAYSSRNAFDSIVISAYIGLAAVGIYNNYMYVLSAITAVLSIIFSAMQGGIGNSIASESIEKNYNDFKKINFLYMWIAGWCSICMLVLFQPFMKLWVGTDYMYPTIVMSLFCFYFYCMKLTDSIGAYIGGCGLWWKCKHAYIIEAVLNLILNIGLGYLWGITGVIIATIVTVLFVNVTFNVYILFRDYFGKHKLKEYIAQTIVFLFITGIAGIATYFVGALLPEYDSKVMQFIMLIAKGFICIILPNIIYVLLLCKTTILGESKNWILQKIIGYKNKH